MQTTLKPNFCNSRPLGKPPTTTKREIWGQLIQTCETTRPHFNFIDLGLLPLIYRKLSAKEVMKYAIKQCVTPTPPHQPTSESIVPNPPSFFLGGGGLSL